MTYAIDDDPMTPCEHESEVKHQIEQVRTDVNNISPLTETRPKIVDGSEVRLIDTDGNEIVPGKKYYLKMRQEEDSEEERGERDILYCFSGEISAGVGTQDLEVTCEVSNGILYLKHENEYIVATDDDVLQVGTTSLLPTEAQRLQFHLTYDCMFLISKWNQLDYVSVFWAKYAAGCIVFGQFYQGQEPMEFYLEPIDQSWPCKL